MVSIAKFAASLNDVERILKKIGFRPVRNYHADYHGIAARLRYLSYVEQWKACFAERRYDFVLFDLSILQFQLSPLAYSYMECPYDTQSFEAFIADKRHDTTEDLVHLRAEYDLYVTTTDTRPITPVRFDYDTSTYREGVHPAAHVHIGFRSNVRVATERILNPVSFMLLIVRQAYPEQWERIINTRAVTDRAGEIRRNLELVPRKYRTDTDRREMYFA